MFLTLLHLLVFQVTAVTFTEPPELNNKLGAIYKETQIKELVNYHATKYNVDADKMMKTLWCESRFSNVQSNIVDNGIRENSWGIAQINLRWNPEVSQEQALTPEFAIEWMAREFKANHQSKWTCYRTIYGTQ